MWIYQDAWFNQGYFDKGVKINYLTHKQNNGVYLMVIEGSIQIAGEVLYKRDAIGITQAQNIQIKAQSECRLLLMETPMNW
ncbi:hypothetical protein JCM21142_72965 [Saccharicrinis fermentans DSM 9555 = JCM 21142]|uniref:Quercetin 2,3-dioxygenase C-terminal cupin domain-containing protein n=1 Tax=Saccharicrinis fermentans DSM 9555 = JCM 21142 TaxID=869213 RepID=W7Y9S1_9BACT|nr:hypothetical protein JCM21142_72965 [Saccharicrinis fermentans DSM 9555 = JCM 21142]